MRAMVSNRGGQRTVSAGFRAENDKPIKPPVSKSQSAAVRLSLRFQWMAVSRFCGWFGRTVSVVE